MKIFKRNALVWSLAGLLVLSPLFASAKESKGQPVAKVSISRALQQNIAEQIWLPGTVVSRQDSRIATEGAGRIQWIADVGEQYTKGEVLVQLNDQLLQLTLDDNNANIERLKARVGLLDKQLSRLQKLAQNASRDELDEKESALLMAQQALSQARIGKSRTLVQLAQVQIKAPFDGTVVERLQQIGEYSHIGSAVLRLVNMDDLEVQVQAPLTAAKFVKIGEQVVVKDREQQVATVVRTLVPVGDLRSRMMEIRVDLGQKIWPVGSAVRVALPNSYFHEAVTVHRDALILRQEDMYVFVVDEQDNARRVSVTTGTGFNDFIEVKGGINANDTVIIRGAERLQPGQKVRYDSIVQVAGLR
ncbi:MAG: multidrug efflux system membrane fusion protein [Alteromonadaceae bacterium]|jgi:multidrug efflux system membrane fusion protein